MEGGNTTGSTAPLASDGSETQALYVCLPSNVMRRQKRPLDKPTMYANYTNTNRDSLIQMFLDASADEVYDNGRLVTQQSGESTVELIAYGWNKIAEYDEATDTVTVFACHAGNISKTVTRYVNLVHEMAGKRETRTVNVLADAAPNVGRPPAEAAQFIGNYRSFEGKPSSLDEWATEKVNRTLRRLL